MIIYKSFRKDIKLQGFIKNNNDYFSIEIVGKGMRCNLPIPIRSVIWKTDCSKYKLKKIEINYCIDSNTMRIHKIIPDTIIPHVVYWLTSYNFAISYYDRSNV